MLTTGNKVGCFSKDAFVPPEQPEYILPTLVASYQSAWNTQEQQKSQYSSEVTKYARLQLDTPMIDWKLTKRCYLSHGSSVYLDCASGLS